MKLETDGTFSGRGIKRSNDYLLVLDSGMFAATPKAVFAAIAVSLASRGGDTLERAQSDIIAEWQTLFDQGIVPQDPKKYLGHRWE